MTHSFDKGWNLIGSFGYKNTVNQMFGPIANQLVGHRVIRTYLSCCPDLYYKFQ